MFTYHLASSVGVIGGADVTTAIFVTGTPSTALVIVICLAAGLAAGLVVGILYKRAKRKKDDEEL